MKNGRTTLENQLLITSVNLLLLFTLSCSKEEIQKLSPSEDIKNVSVFQLYSGRYCKLEKPGSDLDINCEFSASLKDPTSETCKKALEEGYRTIRFPDQNKRMKICKSFEGKDLSERESLRFFVLGDLGVGENKSKNHHQQKVANAMHHICPPRSNERDWGCDFALMAGDLIYPSGVSDVFDSALNRRFDDIYKSFGSFPFYGSLGNHDYEGSVKALIEYKHFSDRWRVLDLFFSVPSLPSWANIRVIDSNGFVTGSPAPATESAQITWLNQNCPENDGWHFLLGHHPTASSGKHGGNKEVLDSLYQLHEECAVDVYFAGHDHHLEHLSSSDIFDVFINGGGGARTKSANRRESDFSLTSSSGEKLSKTQNFVAATHGFIIVDLTPQSMTASIYDVHALPYDERAERFETSVTRQDFAYRCKMDFERRADGCIPIQALAAKEDK